MKKKIININNKVFVLAIFVLFAFVIFSGSTINALEINNNLISIDKITSTVDINDDFDDSCVIVVLDRNVSEINKNHDDTIFKDIKCSKITDLTYYPDKSVIKDVDNFEQIFEIELFEPSKENVLNMIAKLEKIEGIKYAEPNYYLEPEKVPNDKFYPSSSIFPSGQWAISNIELDKVWDFTTGSKNVRVGVIDSGIPYHPDIADNLVAGYDFTNMNEDGTPGWLRNDNDPHGTEVAGIIGAKGNNDKGVCGANWNVSIVSMQVYNNDHKYCNDAVIRAINFATRTWNTENRISILNLSEGSENEEEVIGIDTAIREYPGLFVCSAGNRSVDSDINPHYPSFYGSDLYSDPIKNIISVGKIDEKNQLPEESSNWGEKTIMIYAPGYYVATTYPTELCNYDSSKCHDTRFHFSYGYHHAKGSSFAAPYVTGVAALLLSVSPDLSTSELKNIILDSADTITITVGKNNQQQDVKKLNAFSALKKLLQRSHQSYLLGHDGNDINISSSIDAKNRYMVNRIGFNQLNVETSNYYMFDISSSDKISVHLYDYEFNELDKQYISSSTNSETFYVYLTPDLYFLNVSFDDIYKSGTISTVISPKQDKFLSDGAENITLNAYFNDNLYYYDCKETGFYQFRLSGKMFDGSDFRSYNNSVILKNEKGNLINKFSYIDYGSLSTTIYNSMVVYITSLETYSLEIHVPLEELNSLYIEIKKLDDEKVINLFDLLENQNDTISIVDNNEMGDYFEKFTINQRGKFNLKLSYDGNIQLSFALFKQTYDPSADLYEYKILLSDELNENSMTYTLCTIFEPGIYYIGYTNNFGANVNISLERIVTHSGGNVLVVDPDKSTPSGSQINIVEKDQQTKSYRRYFITVGFTRIIYPYHGAADSRLKYDWYSSDDSIATVTQYGTVYGKSVGKVKIMAALKEDPSKVYVATFNIIEDDGTEIVEVESQITINFNDLSNNDYKLPLDKVNCPYPSFISYIWDEPQTNNIGQVTINNWGYIYASNRGDFTIKGTYQINQRFIIVIHVIIE